jgi:hypothetical protein
MAQEIPPVTKMECPTCGATLELSTAPAHIDRRVNTGTDYHLIFDDVPSLVYPQCNQVVRDAEIADLLGQAVTTLDAISRKMAAFEYKLPIAGSKAPTTKEVHRA